MGIIIAVAIAIVIYVFVAIDVSVSFWDFFVKNSETIRNLALGWGALLAIGLALWRSMVTHMQAETALRQAEIAQRGLLSNRYQRAVEMLGHTYIAVRIGGIRALRDLALEHPVEFHQEVLYLLGTYSVGKDREVIVRDEEDADKTYPADEWEARQAAKMLSEHETASQGKPVRRWWSEVDT